MRLSAPTIANLAQRAGFRSRGQQVATALAFAASGANTEYHRTAGLAGTGDWRGLWAIDIDRWPVAARYDLWEPYEAARAAHQLTMDCAGFGWSPQYQAGTWIAYDDIARAAVTYLPAGEPASTPNDLAGITHRIGALTDHATMLRTRIDNAPKPGRR